jgi:hypothetical protein
MQIPTSDHPSLAKTANAATIIFITNSCIFAFVFIAWCSMNSDVDFNFSRLVGLYAFLLVLVLGLFLIILRDPLELLPDLTTRNMILRLLLYLTGAGSMAFLAIAATYTGGIFESPFSWIFEVVIVLSLMISRYAPDSQQDGSVQPAASVPIVTVIWIFIIYVCSELWPIAHQDRHYWNVRSLYVVQWTHAFLATFIILLIWWVSDRLDRNEHKPRSK